MVQQTPAQARVVDPILTTHVQGYRHPQYVGEALFPRIPVAVSGGRVIEFGKESFKAYSSLRAPGASTRRIRFGYEGKPYGLSNHALEAPVPRELQRDASQVPGIDLGTRAVNLTLRTLLLELEVEQAALATATANYDAQHRVTLSGTDQWSDPAGLPTDDIETGKEAIRSSVGHYPNVCLLSAVAFRAAKNNPSVIERFKYTSRDSVTAEMLASLWDLERVVVGGAVQADDAGAFTDVWGNNAILAYVPATPSSMEEPSYGYTYTMQGHPLVEEPYYDNNAKSWIYGTGFERAAVLTGITAGYLIEDPN